MGAPLPPQADPNLRVTPGDPEYGVHAFGMAWHDLWTFTTSVAQGLYVDLRFAQILSDNS